MPLNTLRSPIVPSEPSVDMRGGIVGDEEYLVWEPFTRMAFRFNACSTRAVAAFAEDYRVEVIPGGCRMTWTLAQNPVGPAALAMFVVRPVLNLAFRRFLSNLRPLHRQTLRRNVLGLAVTRPRHQPQMPWKISLARPAAASRVAGMVKSPKGVTKVSEITSPPAVVEARSE